MCYFVTLLMCIAKRRVLHRGCCNSSSLALFFFLLFSSIFCVRDALVVCFFFAFILFSRRMHLFTPSFLEQWRRRPMTSLALRRTPYAIFAHNISFECFFFFSAVSFLFFVFCHSKSIWTLFSIPAHWIRVYALIFLWKQVFAFFSPIPLDDLLYK